MKRQKAEGRRQKVLLVTVFLLFTVHCSLFTSAFAANWGGVDESVVEKYAEEHGRAPREPLINTDQGDLLLFMFLTGGAIGGFAAGYYWRTLMEDRTKTAENKAQITDRGEG
jgi:ABC-type cobalt transport system substrate-binding protein